MNNDSGLLTEEEYLEDQLESLLELPEDAEDESIKELNFEDES